MALYESLITANKAKSALLVALFVLFYTALIFAVVMSALALVYGWRIVHDGFAVLAALLAAHALAIALAATCYVCGPEMVLSSICAEPVLRAQDATLHDVVEEVAVAAGIPAPAIYMIDTPALNAMATGLGPGRSAVVVTRGLRERLSRDELQAVVAHEMARIQNYDAYLMTLVAGLMGLSILAVEFVKALFEDKELVPVLAAVLLVPVFLPLLALAPLFGRFIQLAVARQRQFLADADAARLTRYPEALAHALEVMAADGVPMHAVNLATAHLFIVAPRAADGDTFGGDGYSMWSAHPPVDERIQRLRSIGNIEG